MRKKNERKLLEAIWFLKKSDISGKQGPAVPGPPRLMGQRTPLKAPWAAEAPRCP